jgi:hypothetical protein
LPPAAVSAAPAISVGQESTSMFRGWAQRERRVYGEGLGPQPDPAHLFADMCQNTNSGGPAAGVSSFELTLVGCHSLNDPFRRTKRWSVQETLQSG